MRQSTHSKLFPNGDERVCTLSTVDGPNGSTIHVVYYSTDTGPRVCVIQEWLHEQDGFNVWVETPNRLDATRKAMGLE